ncbi:hypothetical protein FKP32DRAFT_551368 [Trametes sanguinea]|nr:hypothetical protein FKP32DRAFT_551368 [Trametes sanguinea]
MASPTPVVIVDDANPAIVYEPASLWKHHDHQDNFHNGTWSGGFTARFSFNGTRYTLWGAVLPPKTKKLVSPPSGQVIQDGVPQTPFLASTGDGNDVYYTFNYWGPIDVPAGEHTIEIHVTNGDEENNWPFVLDYIEYVPLPSTVAAPSSTTAPSASPSTSQTHAASETSARRSKPPVGPIVGGVLGAVAGLGICFLLAFWWLRQRRKPHPVQPVWIKDILDEAVAFLPESKSSNTTTAPSSQFVTNSGRGELRAVSGTKPSPSPLLSAPTSPSHPLPHGEGDVLLSQVSPVSANPPRPGLWIVANASEPETPHGGGQPLADSATPPPLATIVPSAPVTSTPSNSKDHARHAERRTRPPVPERSTTLFHSDSGMRFGPPPPVPLPDDFASVVLSEVPPEYTER